MGLTLILCEKPDLALNIAMGLNDLKINGKIIKYEELDNHEMQLLIEKEQNSKNYLMTTYNKKEYKIVWASGHILQFKQAKDYDEKYNRWSLDIFPFLPDELEKKIMTNHIDDFNYLKSEMNKKEVELIINNCDPDREGEAIFTEIYKLAECTKPVKRAWVNSLTRESIRKAYDNLIDGKEMLSLCSAAECRASADFYLGINLTAVCTQVYNTNSMRNKTISIGRVQTPILAAIVGRDKKIDKFVKEKYYNLICKMKNADGRILHLKYEEVIRDEKEAYDVAEDLINRKVIIDTIDKDYPEEKSPLLYSHGSIVMDANENYGMYGSDVNKALESLFLKKIITYPRTDSRYITTDMKDKVKRVIENLPPRYDDIKSMIVENKIDFHNDRVFNDEKVHGHPAIIPTEVKHNFEKLQSLSDNEIKIYGLIVRSFLKCFMTNTVFESYCVEGIDDKSKKYTLKLKKIIEPGFRYANKGYGSNLHDDSKNEIEIKTINHLSPDDEFIIQRVKLKKGETVPAKHYTDATIMLLMENASRLIADEELRKKYKNQKLGTPATRTQIIERLIKLGYVRRINKNDIVATELGYNVIDNIKLEDLKQADMTAAWEYKLNQIENNEFSKDEFIKEIKDYTTEKCDILKKEIDNIDPEEILGFCPDCGGKVYKNKFGSYNCENVLKKTCLFKITDNLKGKPIYDDIVKEILAAGKTKKLRGFISTKNNSKYPYSAYLILKKVDDRTYVNVSFEEP